MKRIRVAFFGSSIDDYRKDTQTLFECIFSVFDEVTVINGGYQGTMKTVSEIGKQIAQKNNKLIFIQSVLFDGYKNDPDQTGVNVPNKISDSQISSKSIGIRVQSMIELADIVVALPGKTGTLHEIIQTIETIQYGKVYSEVEDNFKRLFIHSNWKKSIDSLFSNGNMSSKVYNNIANSLFSFESKKEKKKEQIINRLNAVKNLLQENDTESKEDAITPLPIRSILSLEYLQSEHKIVNIVSQINKVLLGAYYDGEKNKLVGFDIALKETNKEKGRLFRLDSVGSSNYFKILNDFLSNYKSIIDNEQPRINKWLRINNTRTTEIGELFYHDHKNNSQLNGDKEATIENWVEYLEHNKLGKSLFWMSVSIANGYHISAFLLLDVHLPEYLRNEVERVINNFLLEYILIESAEDYIENELEYSTKAAISEIINRNMAHHLTSHVSNRATLDKVLERLGKNYSDLQNGVFYATVLDLLNRFNQYRDERSEYLTYITNFSSPSNAFIFQDVFRPFIENTLLMDNIAANENINYQMDSIHSEKNKNKLCLKIKVEDDKGEIIDMVGNYIGQYYNTETLPYFRQKITTNGEVFEFPYENCELNSDLKDIEISLPGTLGKHALYSILENFIRNSAKHGSDIKNSELEIILLLSDLNNQDEITVTLTDNCSLIKNANEKILIDIDGFNKSIETPILERKDLGLIDMKVNACLLAGMELNDKNCKKALRAKNYNGKLAFQFKIVKPKKAVFIGDFNKRKENKDGFFYYQNIDEFRNDNISKSFEFAVLSDYLFEKRHEILSCELPARVLRHSNIDMQKATSIEYLYSEWLKIIRGEEKAKIHIYFEQNKSTSPTKEFANKFNGDINDNITIYTDELLQSTETIEGTKNILFDRHGGLIRKFKKSLLTADNSWMLIDKNNLDFDYITQYDIDNKANLLPYELEEAGVLKVLIIDERIAEQSSKSLNNDTNVTKLTEFERTDFFKFEKAGKYQNLTLFDIAWASNLFIATHLNEKALKQEINTKFQHKLNVLFNAGRIELTTNIISNFANRKDGKWVADGVEVVEPICDSISIRPDMIVFHRTKLQELISQNANFVGQLLANNSNLNIIVTTGSGTTHGIDGNFKILPFSTLSHMMLGKRVQKLRLSKLLLQLTKNKV